MPVRVPVRRYYRFNSSGSLAMLAAMRRALEAGSDCWFSQETPGPIFDISFRGLWRDRRRNGSCRSHMPVCNYQGILWCLPGGGSFPRAGPVRLFLEPHCLPPFIRHGRKIQVWLAANLIRFTQTMRKSRFNGIMPAPRTDPAHLFVVERRRRRRIRPRNSVGYLFGNVTSQRRSTGTGGRYFL
jgi:hypothetical protein